MVIKWSLMNLKINEIQNIFNSLIKSLEIVYLLEDIKPVTRIMVHEKDKGLFSFLNKNNLSYLKSDFKIKKQDNGAYSDKGIKIDVKSKEEGYFFVYVSKKKELAKAAKQLESRGKHMELGLLLGYPKCCSEFFERNYEEQSKRNNDFTLIALRNSNGFIFPFYTNIATRHFDISLLSHFPCRFNCSCSIKIAKQRLELIKEYSKETADLIEGIMKGAVIYSEDRGVFLLRYPRLKDSKIFYQGIMATRNNKIYELLRNAEYIEILNKNSIAIGKIEINNIGIMLFF